MSAFQLASYGRPLVEVDQAVPQPAGTEVLLRVLAAGVCHTDLHVCDGGFDLGDGHALEFKDRGVHLPLTMGHETVGSPIAIGEAAAGVRLGSNYLVYPWIGCGVCSECASGAENLCSQPRFLGIHRNGGYADHLLVPHPRYLIDIGSLPPESMAPLACSGLTVYSAMKKLGPVIHEAPVVVIGAGGLGLMCIAVLRALGARGAVVVDIDPHKLAAATAAGALAVVDSSKQDALASISLALGGTARAVIDCVGNPATASLGFDCLGRSGRLIVVGLFGGAVRWSLPLIPIKAMTIAGSYVGNLQELRELVELVRTGKLEPMAVTRRSCFDVNSVLDELRAGRVVGRAVLIAHLAA
jgi:propanol-preferring alcohol dehydrogenase